MEIDAAAAPASVPDGSQQGAPVPRPSSERAVPASVSPRIAARHEVAGNGEGDSATALLPLPCADVELPTLSSTHDPACLRTAGGVRGAEASNSGVAGGDRRNMSGEGVDGACVPLKATSQCEIFGACATNDGAEGPLVLSSQSISVVRQDAHASRSSPHRDGDVCASTEGGGIAKT
jgi:hypothetical protein